MSDAHYKPNSDPDLQNKLDTDFIEDFKIFCNICKFESNFESGSKCKCVVGSNYPYKDTCKSDPKSEQEGDTPNPQVKTKIADKRSEPKSGSCSSIQLVEQDSIAIKDDSDKIAKESNSVVDRGRNTAQLNPKELKKAAPSKLIITKIQKLQYLSS